jgi:hypothetical protein
MLKKTLLFLLSTCVFAKTNSNQTLKIEAELSQTYSYDADKYLKTIDAKVKKMQMDQHFNLKIESSDTLDVSSIL